MNQERPYNLSNQALPLQPNSLSLARTFEVQIEKLIDELVVFNVYENDSVCGKVNRIEGNIIEIQTARNNLSYLNLHHLKLVYKV